MQDERVTLLDFVLVRQNTLPLPVLRMTFVAVKDWISAVEKEVRVKRHALCERERFDVILTNLRSRQPDDVMETRG